MNIKQDTRSDVDRKERRRRVWAGGGPVSSHDFSEEDFQEIATALGLDEISEETQFDVVRATALYFIDKELIPKAPKLSEARAAVRKIRKLTEVLIESLEQLDDLSSQELALTEAFKMVVTKEKIYEEPEFFKLIDGPSDIHKLHSAAGEVLQRLKPGKGGRPAEAALKGYIIRLADIFEKVKGVKAGITFDPYEGCLTGSFYKFVMRCLEIVDPEAVWSNFALGRQIERTLKKRREKTASTQNS